MNWLPQEYEAPSSSSENYMKIIEGENKIRILTAPLLCYEEWYEKKPLRYRMGMQPVKTKDPECQMRHVWFFVVWNYNEEKIQILNISQATLRKSLEKLSRDSEWGNPCFFDIKIIKEGKGKETSYSLNPIPPRPLREDIIRAFHAKPCNLDALFDSLDPFAAGWDSYTPGVFSKETESKSYVVLDDKPMRTTISSQEVTELNMIIEECHPTYLDQLMPRLAANALKITKFSEMTPAIYQAVKLDAQKNRDAYIKEQQKKYEAVNIDDVGF